MSALRDALRDLPDAVFADLLESDGAYVLVVDLPGATPETTDVHSTDDRLIVEARRTKATPDGFRYVREDRPLFLDAELPLPPDADGEAADAEMERGVLEVTLPKRTDRLSRTIPIEGDVHDEDHVHTAVSGVDDGSTKREDRSTEGDTVNHDASDDERKP